MSQVENFGRNVVFRPQAVYVPHTEDEVVEILARERGKRIRAVGRLHSWSEAVRSDEVLLDLRRLDRVAINPEQTRVVIGAGCQIKRALAELERHALTLPAIGLISEQTIAGATATGTHGSGRHSLSHYLTSLQIACYDSATGEPILREVREGDELRAARCSLGCLGIVVSVELCPRPQYQVEEWFRLHDTVESVLACETESPLQQFYWTPWLWRFLVQHRREVNRPRSWLAPLYRAYWFTEVDVGLHLVLRFLVQRLRGRAAVKGFLRHVAARAVIRGWRVVDTSSRMLIMEHELFRHIEIEVFVPQSSLAPALEFVRQVLVAFDDRQAVLDPALQHSLENIGLLDELIEASGAYTHHYPICVRRVLPDDTLLSMASSDDEPYYALSFISYARPEDRAGFFRFADFLARSMARLFAVRRHWGKVCPLSSQDVEQLYPGLAAFRAISREFDPDGVFRNSWIEETLFDARVS